MKDVRDRFIIILGFIYIIVIPSVLYFYFIAYELNLPDFLENDKTVDATQSGIILQLNQLVDKSWIRKLHTYLFLLHLLTFDRSKC